MAGKVNIYVALSDDSLKDGLYSLISDDWTIPWKFVSEDGNKANPDATDIAVIDSENLFTTLHPTTLKIFIGEAEDPTPYFTTLKNCDAERVYTELKRAYSYKEITIQNKESLYPEINKSETLESIAQSLSSRVNQLMRQAEMRIALVDQLPVGVLGIDDEGAIVLANPKAIEMLSLEDIPVWGMHVSGILDETVWEFLNDDNMRKMSYKANSRELTLRKNAFFLEENYAGTILVLSDQD